MHQEGYSMAEHRPFSGDWMANRRATFGRMISMFKWIIIFAALLLAGLWIFAA